MEKEHSKQKAPETGKGKSQANLETNSVSSSESKRSRASCASACSSASFAAARARAKAEAAKAKLAFAKREMDIQVQKAQLEASLQALNLEREAEAANAEATILEAAAADIEGSQHIQEIDYAPLRGVKLDRTEEYVTQQSANFCEDSNIEEGSFQYLHPSDVPPPNKVKPEKLSEAQETFQHKYQDKTEKSLHPHAYPAYQTSYAPLPNQPLFQPDVRSDPRNPTDDLARFLARNQLMSSGLSKFDDTPEHYQAWKASFISVIEPLRLSPSEEIDLMVKYLGKESSEHARRIRSINMNQPITGLNAIWSRLNKMYGSVEALENALFSKMEAFPKVQNKDSQKLQELADLLQEVEIAKQSGTLPGLTYLDTARGVQPIVEKLPYSLQDRWMSQGSKYKREHAVCFPPFSFFKDFVCREAEERNDPSFKLPIILNPLHKKEKHGQIRSPVFSNKTSVSQERPSLNPESVKINQNPDNRCPIHNKPHPLSKCRAFLKMSREERIKSLKENSVCFRCCASTSHQAKNCKVSVKCTECGSEKHVAALHPNVSDSTQIPLQSSSATEDGGEEEEREDITSNCTKVCGSGNSNRSCSKICLVNVYPVGHREHLRRMYAILDDQSNLSLARTEFFDMFNVQGTEAPYTLGTCMGVTQAIGRRAYGYIVESIDGTTCLPLPTLIECDQLPNNRTEIPTPEAAYYHQHLRKIAKELPPLDNSSNILLLIGRDLISVHKVRKQISGSNSEPFAQKLDLGWVVIGEVCINGKHRPTAGSSMKTCILDNGRPSLLSKCENKIRVKDNYNIREPDCTIGKSVFQKTDQDNQIALSIKDKMFLDMMEKGFSQDDSNSWVAPLPFRQPRRRLPNNREYAVKRFASLQRTLQRKPKMEKHFFEFMQRLLDNGHAELAPPLEEGKECWYLPTFGVYHPKKPEQIRVVFDSSAQYDGISLNDVLLQGPDLGNSLLGVLLRFRREPVAVTADIEQMFHCFVVREDCRDVLRFLWYRANNPNNEVVEYRMRVHIFGNSPSPAIAIYGLRKAAKEQEQFYGNKVTHLVEREFYMDDALLSFSSVTEAIDVVGQVQEMLTISNLRLHKIASNSIEVMSHFPAEDRAKDIKDLDLFADELPQQRSLGVIWNIMSDALTFRIPESPKPFTKRGVLSTINSLFDPFGFLAPITIQGRMILRDLTTEDIEWDATLPETKFEKWRQWQESLSVLQELNIPRTYASFPVSTAESKELCVFSDASVNAISAVAYLRLKHPDGHHEVGFILGKAKLAPQHELTIPRLELCAAVLAVELADVIVSEIDLELDEVRFFTDSKVVLGYIHNEKRRFYVFVSNRVQRIRQSSQPQQWSFVPTELNPADCGSRSVAASQLTNTFWLTGPSFLKDPTSMKLSQEERHDLINPEKDAEIRPKGTNMATKISEHELDSHRFERFSDWRSLVKAVARLIHIASCFVKQRSKSRCAGWHYCKDISPMEMIKAEHLVIRTVQQETYGQEVSCLKAKQSLPRNSPILKLNPFVDADSLLRVGGRICQSQLDVSEVHPLIIPNKHHLGELLVRHHHQKVGHQGRHLTEGAIRASGMWLVGGKRLVSSIIYKCVTCRKLRGSSEQQLMSDLPAERLKVDPPFSYVGLDVFGPWEVVTRRTRGGQANNKRWAVLFTCMSTRAIHIEVVESLSSSCFINALRRFFSIRGPAKQLRSDRGTNFVGACGELKLAPRDSPDPDVKDYLLEQKCTWVFNPPHASHMGGSWERMIGVTRRILDSLLLNTIRSKLSHDVLVTLMAEVSAIVNARPLIPVSTDPDAPLILTPSLILTQKTSVPAPLPEEFTDKDSLKNQWRRVQALADNFWSRWRKEYLCTLQKRQKWHSVKTNLKEGDVVLLKDSTAKRNEWPMGVIVKCYPSQDGLVRKVDIKIIRRQGVKIFSRPCTEVILLLTPSDTDI